MKANMKAILIWAISYMVRQLIRFPNDWNNSEQVRVFFVHNGDIVRTLVKQTETHIDDDFVDYVLMLANNKMAWDIAFNAIIRVKANGNDGGIILPNPLPDSETDVVRPIRALLARIRSRLSESGVQP